MLPSPLLKDSETKVHSEIYLSWSGAPETWQPDFCFASRYVQLECASLGDVPDLSIVHSLVGQHVSSSVEQSSSIKTGKEYVNKLCNACYWSFVSNFLSLHTDCPQVEKFGWLEITTLSAHSAQYICNTETLHKKILDGSLKVQELSGFLLNMAPDIGFM